MKLLYLLSLFLSALLISGCSTNNIRQDAITSSNSANSQKNRTTKQHNKTNLTIKKEVTAYIINYHKQYYLITGTEIPNFSSEAQLLNFFKTPINIPQPPDFLANNEGIAICNLKLPKQIPDFKTFSRYKIIYKVPDPTPDHLMEGTITYNVHDKHFNRMLRTVKATKIEKFA